MFKASPWVLQKWEEFFVCKCGTNHTACVMEGAVGQTIDNDYLEKESRLFCLDILFKQIILIMIFFSNVKK